MRSLLFACVLVLAGCAAFGASSTAKAQEAMRECNAHARFGRMVVAAEAVRPTERDAFLQRRLGWGSVVQIADSELLGMKMTDKSEAVCWVRVSWYRVQDGELRQTTIRQTWREKATSEDWELVAENREAGDIGLLGEHVEVLAPSEPRHAQFPTVRIGGTD
jgi:hypothetical protein